MNTNNIIIIRELPETVTEYKQLNDVFKNLGLTREQFNGRIFNIFDEKPPRNNFGIYYKDDARKEPTDKLCKAWVNLQVKVQETRPDCILTLGQEAIRAFVGYKNIEHYRGSIFQTGIPNGFEGGIKLVGTHAFNRKELTPQGIPIKPVVMIDFIRALKESQSPEFREIRRKKRIRPSYFGIMAYLYDCIGKRISVDIENDEDQILCIGIAKSPTDSLCIPFIDKQGEVWSPGNKESIINSLKKLLGNPKTEVIGQNYYHDNFWVLNKWGIITANLWFDNLVAMRVLYPDLPASLAFQTSFLTDIMYYKQDGKDWKKIKDYNMLYNYNCLDCLSTYECADKLWKELNK